MKRLRSAWETDANTTAKAWSPRIWTRVRWEVNKALLLDELSPEALDYCKEVVLTKEKLDQAVRAGYLPPRLYDRAIKRAQLGWNVSLKIIDPLKNEADWEPEE